MLTAKGPQMRAFTSRVCAYSTQSQNTTTSIIFVAKAQTPRQNSLLGPNDVQFPLPGDVAFGRQVLKNNSSKKMEDSAARRPEAISARNPPCNIADILAASNINADTMHLLKLKEEALKEAEQSAPDCPIELSAQKCPRLLKRDMRLLFPLVNTAKLEDVTVLNLTQKSECDMSAWSEVMEEEREKLTAAFVMSANAICTTLRRCGYWADFIDPSSGRPFLEAYTNHTLFETNEAYKQMGFRIEDLGCCKVLQHATWGSHAFVGTIFTSAPLEADIVKGILRKVNHEEEPEGETPQATSSDLKTTDLA